MAYFATFCFVFAIFPSIFGFPIDLSTVGSGQLNSVWLASSPVFAVVFLFIIIFAIFGCVCCRPGKGFQPNEEKSAQEFRNSNGALSVTVDNGFVNPRAGAELTIFPPAGAVTSENLVRSTLPVRLDPPPDPRQGALRPASFSSSERPLSSQDWFYEPHLNFPRGQLQYVQDYGSGWFGRVVEGEATLICPPQPRTKVIVKILHEDATLTDQMFFLHEVKPHRDLKHSNILRLLGRCLETEPFLLLLEHCPNGDLKTFLTQNLGSAQALTEQGVTLKMARDISAGLDFMHQHKFIHTDLAARNCLVTPDLTIKIGDYGNAIELFREDYYIAGSVALPVRWCAPETLRCTDLTIETKEVTTFANVWTLGVVIWEICEFGRLPYEELTDDQVLSRVLGEKNYILGCPKLFCLYKDELYHLMKLCWNPPLQRPTCSQLKVILDNLVSCGNSNIDVTHTDFDSRWQASKPNTIPKTDNADVTSKPHGARVGDSKPEAPIEAFISESKPSVIDSPRFRLKKSDSTQNLSGSLERLNELNQEVNDGYQLERGELDSWLKGVEVNNEEDETFVRNISEAIRDLDAALAMEKTSSSEETSGKSSKENSPGRSVKISSGKDDENVNRGFTVDFKLGGDTSSFMSIPPKSFELSSLQNTVEPQSLTFTSLIFPEGRPDPVLIPSISDTEEELWKTRIERCEFSEKVKEKSKSIADLMVLTHIDPSDDSDEGDKERNSFLWRTTTQRPSLSSNNFGSESDIRHAVLKEGFEEVLKKLSNDHKEYGRFDSLNMIVTDQSRRESVLKTFEGSQNDDHIFLGDVASEKCDNTGLVQDCACNIEENSSSQIEESKKVPEISIDTAVEEPTPEEEESVVFHYEKKPLKFVLKDEEETSEVILGPFEDHTLNHYQGVRTTFGNACIIDNWSEHLDSALQEQFNRNNFDSITFQSLDSKVIQEQEEPIINKITNLSDSNLWSEEEADGKLRTPDDERSSDSGFRDKGSLSESVEDACEGKYNLEDIEAELEEAFVKGAFNKAEENEKKTTGMNFEYEESQFYEDEKKNDEDFCDVDGEIDFWQPNDREYYPEISEFSPVAAEGWYLHPPEEKSGESLQDDDDEFVKALRNELQEKLPVQSRSFEQEDENQSEPSSGRLNINIMYTHTSPLTPIFEENSEPSPKSPNGTSRPRRKNVVGLMESVRNIDNETFMQYLDFMVENEGKDDDGLIEEVNVPAEEEEINSPAIVIKKDPTAELDFEGDIKKALGFPDSNDISDSSPLSDANQPRSIVVLEDLEVSTSEVINETRSGDDVLLVNTSTNEAKILGSPKPIVSHVAFLNDDYSPDSISSEREVSVSDDSSRGEASTDINSSPDLLSDFFITPDKTPFQSPRTVPRVTAVEELNKNDEASEIVDALLESGMIGAVEEPDHVIADQPGSLPYISQKPLNNFSSTELFLRSERIHTADLLLESSKKLERFEMSTSFMGDDDEVSDDGKEGTTEGSAITSEKAEGTYTPDWETDSGEENSSSSGEFIWKDGGSESKVKAKQASSVDIDISLHENSASDAGVAAEGDGDDIDEEDDASSTDSASIMDFVPSAWDSQAAPLRSALKSPDKKTEPPKRRVWFKKEKYHCIYEYPREPSDTEDAEPTTNHLIDYSQYADWELQDGEGGDELDESLTDTDSDMKLLAAKKSAKDKCDFYTLSPFDEFGSTGTLSEDGDFFVSSSTRPFQSNGGVGSIFTGSQFSAFGSTGLWASSPTTDNLLDERDFVTPDSGVEDLASASTPGDNPPDKLNATTTTTTATRENLETTNSADDDALSKPPPPPPPLFLGPARRPDRESLTLNLPKSHNADLGLVLNGLKNKGQGLESA